jgi:RimJ/RimL family protein N-acetyltransferase
VTIILETTRMRLREFTADDLETLAPMVADEEQMRFYPRSRTRDDASEWIERNVALYERIGFGFWYLESVSTEAFLGYAGIRPQEELAATEIGWHIGKENWNRGLATEAALACRDLAFGRFGLDRLVALIDGEHHASIRVAKKIGMHREKEAVVDNYPWVIFAMDHGLGLVRAESV